LNNTDHFSVNRWVTLRAGKHHK